MKNTLKDLPANQVNRPHKSNVGVWVISLLVVLAVGQAGYVYWQRTSLNKNIEIAKEKISTKEAKIKELTEGTEVADHLDGIAALEKAAEKRVLWSNAQREITRIEKMLQTDVQFLDYAGAPEGNFSIQGVGYSLNAIANLLDTMKQSESFGDPFVTNISEQANTEYDFAGRRPQKVYLFTLLFNFEDL